MLSITHTTLTGNVPEASELGTIMDKLFIPNGVHYRGVPLYCRKAASQNRVRQWESGKI